MKLIIAFLLILNGKLLFNLAISDESQNIKKLKVSACYRLVQANLKYNDVFIFYSEKQWRSSRSHGLFFGFTRNKNIALAYAATL